MSGPAVITITYDPSEALGYMSLDSFSSSSVWERIHQSALELGVDFNVTANRMSMPWAAVLSIVRLYGNQDSYRSLNFRFQSGDELAKSKLANFAQQFKQVRASRGSLTLTISQDEIKSRLIAEGFTRKLEWFQVRDLQKLISLQNGANFSVPGAGKTTVTLALHILVDREDTKLLVISPKAAFPAWRDVVKECVKQDAPHGNAEEFQILSGSPEIVRRALSSPGRRFVINYDLMIQMPEVIAAFVAQNRVHLVLDESHRMKAGFASQRGALLLGVSTDPVRRDILSGTPMPQSVGDIQSQLDFLWPGSGLGIRIDRGAPPREVLGDLYVRTTKVDLNLPKPKRQFVPVDMADGQLALYGIVKTEFLRQASTLRFESRFDAAAAKKSVMRLLQLSVNPVLALRSIVDDAIGLNSGIIDQVLSEGPSLKMRAVATLARDLARQGRKTVIWTIFTGTILEMETLLADLNPVTLYGAVPSGVPTDSSTREGRIRRFHDDPNCMVMIANPAAAGEGISLHKACHDAVYLDRSYVTTHYLQSIDRIHRLGLAKDVETNIYIYQTLAPRGLGSIDHSVSRRMAEKLRAMQVLLDDPDLNEIALDEENADDPVAWDIDPEDVRDLINELEGKVAWSEKDAE